MSNKIAIIGGSGVDKCPLFQDAEWSTEHTEYVVTFPDGTKTDGVVSYQEVDGVIFIPRHGRHGSSDKSVPDSRMGPSRTQYAANLIAAHMLGARHVVATSAVGSLNGGRRHRLGAKVRGLIGNNLADKLRVPNRIDVGSLVVPHDYIDESGRDSNLFGVGLVVHTNRRPAFDPGLRQILVQAGVGHEPFTAVYDGGVYVCIPGDDFGTHAEGMKRRRYADIVGMTVCPEASIAMQLGMRYGMAAFPVDLDTDASHEGATLKVMETLGSPVGIPAYTMRVIEAARAYAQTPQAQGPLPQLETGGIIPGDTSRIKHGYLRQVARAHIEQLCK